MARLQLLLLGSVLWKTRPNRGELEGEDFQLTYVRREFFQLSKLLHGGVTIQIWNHSSISSVTHIRNMKGFMLQARSCTTWFLWYLPILWALSILRFKVLLQMVKESKRKTVPLSVKMSPPHPQCVPPWSKVWHGTCLQPGKLSA